MHEDGDQYSMLKPVCKRCWRVDDVEALPYILDRAFRLAESGRPGPVLVDIPMDMFSREMEEDLWSRTYRDSHAPVKPALDPAAIKAALWDVTYTGVTGDIAFDDIGDAIRDTAYIKVADTANSAWALETMQKAG